MASDLGMKLGVEGEKKFRDAINNIGEKFKTLESEMKLVESQFGKNDTSTAALTSKNQVLTKEIEAQTEKIHAIQEALAASSEKYGENDTRTQSWQRALNNAQADLNNLNTRLGENESALQSAGNASGEAANKVGEVGTKASSSGGLLSTLKDTAGNLATTMGTNLKDAVGNVASALGDTLAGAAGLAMDALKNIGSAALNFAKDSVQVGQNFDSSMSQVAAVSGASGDDLEALRQKAQEMGASTKFSASEAADAMNYMAMAGWKTNDMIGGIEGIMNLAAASGEDLATTSDIVTDALTAFGLSASDSGHFADILAAASSNANTNVSMMGETFKYAAPVAGSLGFSAEDTAEAIGLMANAGIKASSAGTSLRRILTEMSGPISVCGEALGQVQIATTNADGSMRPLRDILADLRVAFNGLSESEQANQASAIFGTNAMSGFLALMNAAPQDVEKLEGAIDGCTQDVYAMNSALKDSGIEWDKYKDEFWGQGDGFGTDAQDYIASVTAYRLGSLRETAEEAQKYLELKFHMDSSDAEKAVQIMQKNVQGIDTAVSNLGIDWSKYSDTMFEYGSGMEGLIGEIISLYGEFDLEEIPEYLERVYGMDSSDAVAAVQAVGDAMLTTTGSAQKMAEVMQDNLAGDITIFQSAMEGAQIALSDQLTPALREFVQFGTDAVSGLTTAFQEGGLEGLFSELGNVIADAGTMLAEMLPGMVTAGGQMLTSLMQGITDNLPQLQETLSGLIQSFATFLTEQLPQIITSGCELLTGLLTGISQTIPEIAPQLGEVITTIVTTLIDCLPQLLEAGGQLLMSLAEGIISMLPDLITMLPDIITAIVDFVSENLPTILQAGADILTQLVEGIASTIPTLSEKMPEVIASITDFIQNSLPDILQTGVDILTNIIQGITDTIPTLVDALPEVLDGFMNFFVDNATSIIDTGIDVLMNLIDGILDALPDLIEAIPEIISAFIDTITSNLPKIVQNGIDLLVKFASGILDAIPKLVEQVPKILEAIIKTITENLPKIISCGKTLVENLFKQLPSAISTLASKVPQIITSIVNALQNGLSQIAQVGKNLITGLWNGINDAKQWILDKIKGFGDSVLSAIKGFFGIASPSKEMAWVGEMLGAGLGEGIEKSTKGAVMDAQGMAKDVSGALSTISLPDLGDVNARVAATTSFGSQGQSPIDTLAASLDPNVMAGAISRALNGVGVYLSGRKVGTLVTMEQSNAVKARAGAIIPV